MLKTAKSCKEAILLWRLNNTREYFNAGGNRAVMRILPHVKLLSLYKLFQKSFACFWIDKVNKLKITGASRKLRLKFVLQIFDYIYKLTLGFFLTLLFLIKSG